MLRPPPRSPLFPYTTLFRSLDELGDLAVADHVAPAGRERKVLEHRLTAERPARIHAQLDVADQIVESDTRLPRRRSEEHTSELQSHSDLVCRLLLEKKKKTK